ncbi:DUF6491 family protein [Aliikangiella sp. IMCC44653]
MIRLIAVFLMLNLLVACAGQQTTAKQRAQLYSDYVAKHKIESVERISAFKFHGWRSLDSNHLIISTSVSRNYLLTLHTSCFELEHAHGIVVNNRFGSSLQSGFDSISTAGMPQQKCTIKSIHPLTKEQADEVTGLRKALLKQLKKNQEK